MSVASETCEPRLRSADPVGAVAILASAGGLGALIPLLGSLPDTFPLPIFVAQHLRPGPTRLDGILGRYCPLNVSWAVHGAQPREGHVYLVPPGMWLSVTRGGFRVSPLPPLASSWLWAADHLIASVVELYGPRSIGVVLSGMMATGVNALRAVKASGGFAIAQDHTTSEHFEMPSAAIDLAKAEIVMPPERIASVLKIISRSWQEGGCPVSNESGRSVPALR